MKSSFEQRFSALFGALQAIQLELRSLGFGLPQRRASGTRQARALLKGLARALRLGASLHLPKPFATRGMNDRHPGLQTFRFVSRAFGT